MDARLKQHQATKRGGITRADADTRIKSMGGYKEGSLTYSQSKGYEQAYREMHKTKNGFPGNVIEPINKSRTDPRGKSHTKHYKQEMKRNGQKPSTC